MKITKLECIPVSSPLVKPIIMPETYITHIHSVLLKIHTDEGLVGVGDTGDTSTWYRGETQESISAIITEHIGPRVLLGEDPRKIEKIMGRIDRLVRDNNQAKALVDFALHDLKGKILGVPVYELLGGRTVDAVQLGWVLSAGRPEDLVPEARRAVDAGYGLIKMKIGNPSLAEDIEMMKGVREGLGDDVRLVADANGFWNYEDALKALRAVDDIGLECIEQPLPHWDIEGMARLRQQVGTPVYADEAAQELHHIREIIERRAADGLFIKLQKAGGLLKSQRWLTMARLANMSVMSGCMSGSGLEASPAAHLLVADQWASQFTHENLGPVTNNARYETVDPPITADIAKNVPRYEGGRMYPNEGPGLGIELNEDYIAENRTPGKPVTTAG